MKIRRCVAVVAITGCAVCPWLAEPRAITRGGPAVNYIEATPTIATAGMPTRRELQAIAQGGYAAVINLAPTGAMGSHDDEQAIVEDGGTRYVHVPVEFSQPRRTDFERFTRELQALDGKRVLVHCQINMRASVFVFLYRVTALGEDSDRAFEGVLEIWQPNAVWSQFIRTELQAYGKPLPLALN